MFTLEIGGRPMAVMNTSEEDARAIVEGEGFREDLTRLKSGNAPLWDGKATLNLRPSNEEEVAEFEESQAEDEEDDDDEDATTILFLVPLDDEDDEEEEEEE
ncbi:hypothetical protein [Pseudoroseomonas ludipueritiae]|uniref:Glutamine amidotransferase n=1 Tax=Pseudoroseomonas ludipueritiae TaxID=198093 RepID=A0ABR7R231_9PROT|nr:hypothetical protein [Pseudoroseomonas ludipueritiae]MBC9175794.1 hypothetical protein [Pseudoroseomonas ludipueritiae]MCG7361084.1 hypothetical protein [Roseomonas sp. ACRSG]